MSCRVVQWPRLRDGWIEYGPVTGRELVTQTQSSDGPGRCLLCATYSPVDDAHHGALMYFRRYEVPTQVARSLRWGREALQCMCCTWPV